MPELQAASCYDNSDNTSDDGSQKNYELIESGSEDETVPSDKWIKIGMIHLTYDDKKILESNDMWLNDKIINAAQVLLKTKFPLIEGFQDTLLQKKHAFEVMSGEFIQIINKSNSHWVTLSNLGLQQHGTIRLYDSLNSSTLNQEVQDIIASLLISRCSVITVKIGRVQQQPDASNCGLFAIAFATLACFGQDPRMVSFEVSAMRKHLLTCIEKREIDLFPVTEICHSTHLDTLYVFRVYCVCRMPLHKDEEEEMPRCNVCNERFHHKCQLESEKHWLLQEEAKVWYCNECWVLVEKKGFTINSIYD